MDDEELVYINYLGNRVEFCGNAARVVGYLNAVKRGMREYRVYASGYKNVLVKGNTVGIELEVDIRNFGEFSLVGMEGVKHLVFPGRFSPEYLKVLSEGIQKVWENAHFNIYTYTNGCLFVRTWEYGYTYEPGGCATGTLASGADFIMRSGAYTVNVITLSGDKGRVYLKGSKFVLENPIKLRRLPYTL